MNPPGRETAFRTYGQPVLMIAALASLVNAVASAWHDQFPDFRIFYESALALRLGRDPYLAVERLGYGPNVNAPGVLLLFVPFTYLAPLPAAALWLTASIMALVLTARVIAERLHRERSGDLIALALATQAGALAIRQGQLTFALLLVPTLAWLADRDGRTVRAGAWLGVLLYIKPFYGIFALYLLWRREWRCLAASASALGLFALSGLVGAGLAVHRSWLATLTSVGWQAHTANASVRGLAARLFAAPPPYGYRLDYTPLIVNRGVELAVFVLGTAVIAGVTALAIRESKDRDYQWALLTVAAVLLSPLGWIYYLPIGLGPISATILRSRRWAGAWAVGVMLAVPYAVLADAPRGPLGTVVISSWFFWATLLLWITLLIRRD